MKTFSFVIPTYNHYDLLHQVLFDIYKNCRPVDEVIVVDDCSTDDGYQSGLSWWKMNGMLNIRHVKTKENYGFLKASNVGLKKSTGDVICLLSNDVRLIGNVSKEVLDALSEKRGGTLVGGRLLDFDTGWNEFNGRIFSYLEGWLLATTKGAWKELGYLDEQFAPHDFEDVDLSTTALALGYKLIALPSELTHHIGGQSIGFHPEREEITKRNREVFKHKWITKPSDKE